MATKNRTLASLYWLHLPEHTDVKTQGYVGVSQDPNARFQGHRYCRKKSKIRSALDKYGDQIVLSILECGDEKYCYEREAQLRPTKEIGWNLVEGGGKPPVHSGETHHSKRPENRMKMSKKFKGKPSPLKGRELGPMSEERKRALRVPKQNKDGMFGFSNIKGKKIKNPRTEEWKQKQSTSQSGKHWYNNGVVTVFTKEKPDGFSLGRIYKREK